MRKSGDKEKKMEETKTQAPRITDAVTYIVDENGVEKKLDPITQISKDDSTDSKKSD